MKDAMIGIDGDVCEGLPCEYDNIDENGEVRYLDAHRLERKERPDKPVFENHPHGIGVKDAIWSKFAVRPSNYDAYGGLFNRIRKNLWRTAYPDELSGKLMRNVFMMPSADKGHSGGVVYNLNVDLSEEAESVVVPVDIVKQAIEKADFIAGMNRCLCRSSNGCEDYPHDLACLFLGVSGRVVVRNGIAREFSKEEAYARLEKAAELGLVCMSLWIEVEQLLWGLRNDQVSDMVEICFCCPCCCLTLNLCKSSTRDIRDRFTPSGFTATVDHEKCIGCYKCMATRCPQDALQARASDGKVVVNQETCFGCGYCKPACPTGAIQIKQTMPMRENMHEYFLKEARLDLAVDGFPGAGARSTQEDA